MFTLPAPNFHPYTVFIHDSFFLYKIIPLKCCLKQICSAPKHYLCSVLCLAFGIRDIAFHFPVSGYIARFPIIVSPILLHNRIVYYPFSPFYFCLPLILPQFTLYNIQSFLPFFHSTVQCSTVQCSEVQCSTVQ